MGCNRGNKWGNREIILCNSNFFYRFFVEKEKCLSVATSAECFMSISGWFCSANLYIWMMEGYIGIRLVAGIPLHGLS